VPDVAEATLLGAALVAGIGSGVYAGFQQTANALVPSKVEFFEPDPDRHEIYQKIFEQGYLPLLDPLRKIDRNITGLDSINV
jgi:sugar (pentulose or hexulose) kinase